MNSSCLNRLLLFCPAFIILYMLFMHKYDQNEAMHSAIFFYQFTSMWLFFFTLSCQFFKEAALHDEHLVFSLRFII